MSPNSPKFILLGYDRPPTEEQLPRLAAFHEIMLRRRSVRHFSPDPVPLELIKLAICTAATAPSGANQQPWRFVAVSSPDIKRRIREAAEAEEREFYEHRAPNEWLEALAPLGTDWHKEFLEVAPWLIVVFRVDHALATTPDGAEVKHKHYYVMESVGLACGFLLAALHQAGLATLTHTPSPMGFLSRILNRPKNEKPYLLIPVGYPAANARVPEIGKKPLEEIMTVVE